MKKDSKVDISENSSSYQRHNDDEFTDEEIDDIIDQQYNIKLISIASDTSSCIWKSITNKLKQLFLFQQAITMQEVQQL